MTIGSRLDALLEWLPRDALLTILLAVLPFLGFALYVRVLGVPPRSERGVRFNWQPPKEIAYVLILPAISFCLLKFILITRRLDWTSQTIPHPSIHSHLDDPSLLPPTAPNDSKRSYITAFAPASAQHLATVESLNKEEIAERIERAVLAQRKWRSSNWGRRRRVLRSLLEWCVREMEPLAKMASRDSGKTLVDAAFGEILTTSPMDHRKRRGVSQAGLPLFSLPPCRLALTSAALRTNLLMAHKVSKVVYEPLGVVAAIVSWNYPLHSETASSASQTVRRSLIWSRPFADALSPIIASLFSGNAIVVKPSESVAWSSLQVIEAVRTCLAACGEASYIAFLTSRHSDTNLSQFTQDPELVQIVVTLPDSVEALTGDPRIKHITFIGSEEVGKKVALKAAEVGTPVLLELGGKDPCIILPSADVKYFTNTWMRAVFQAASQNCIGAERLLVHSSLYDSFVASMTVRVQDLKLGDVLSPSAASKQIDVGAMVTDRLFGQLEGLIEDAVKGGARCLVGGKRAKKEDVGEGLYFQPTLLVDVKPDMAIAQQEIFAPVMTVLKYDTLAEAVEIANGTRYGLGASVFGKSKKQCRWVMDRLECGMVCSNVFYLNQSLPFGGAKASGNAGRFAGPEGLRSLCNLKAVTEDRFHGLVQTGIPPLLSYPIRSGTGAWTFVSGLVRMVYGAGVLQKAKGLWGLVSAK
ncbi:SPOSA6832_03470 [Sporobolomyces salmonicolor]|uniref:SPOSA6832_03470-mRNA-1:cds n=1 Tax=Sporidiobolus salmonicolor TaxID=5005 RepID=A0A0D6EPL8_SPOSA|nr:SPOSA6832_03470 [Sporobolomyces salmonicolor]